MRLILTLCLLCLLLACLGSPVLAQQEMAAEGDDAAILVIDTINDRLQVLEEKERQQYMLELEGQRKQVDWMIAALTLFAAVVALIGVFVPLMMHSRHKEFFEQERREIEQERREINRLLDTAQTHEQNAAQAAQNAHQHEAEARESKEKIKSYISGEPDRNLNSKEINAAAKQIRQDPKFDPTPGLRAAAIEASEENRAEKAYQLWAALAELNHEDDTALLNAGYWAHEIADQLMNDEALRWYQRAGTYYRQVLALKPDNHVAANNWGTALAKEAEAVAPDDLVAARALWRQAGERYQRALEIKPDNHEAAYNWGYALLQEAHADQVNDMDKADQLRARAEQLLLQHADAAPDVVAYNLACVYGQRGEVADCLHWLKVAQKHKSLPLCEHLKTDTDLDTVRDHPDFQAWLKSVCP